MKAGLIRLRTLSAAERALFLQAVPWVLVIRIALWVIPTRILLKQVSKSVEAARSRSPTAGVRPEVVAWTVRAVARRIPRASCLTQALATQSLLARHGFESRLQIGVARSDAGVFEAHAWVECQGRVVIGGRSVGRYARFPDIMSGTGSQPDAPR